MDGLEQRVCLRIQDIVEKLEKLDCILLGNKDDAWIMELMFKPGFHRYNLIEWLLSKLGYDISKISGPQISAEEKMLNLHSAVSDIGVCRDHQVIKGTAEVKKQLEFWCTLIDIVWLQQEITLNTSTAETDEGIASSEKKECINEEFEKSYSCVKDICDNVNLRQLFAPAFQLFSPDVEIEVNNTSPPKASESHKYPTIPNIEDAIKDLAYNPQQSLERYFPEISKVLVDGMKDYEENTIFKAELDESEQELCNAAVDIQEAQKNFSNTYNELKPLISQVKKEEFTDVGESFKKLEPHLETFSQLEKSVPQLMTSQLKVSKLTSDLDKLRVQKTFSDEKYESILKLVKD